MIKTFFPYYSLWGANNVRSWNREAQRHHGSHLSRSCTVPPSGCEDSVSWGDKYLCQLILLGNKRPFRVWREQDSKDNSTWFKSIIKHHILLQRRPFPGFTPACPYHIYKFSLKKKGEKGLSLEITNRVYLNPASFKLCLKITTKSTQGVHPVNTHI